MNKKKGGLLLSLRKDMNRRAISDRRLEAIFRTFSRHPYIVAAFICLALTGFGSYSYKFLNWRHCVWRFHDNRVFLPQTVFETAR